MIREIESFNERVLVIGNYTAPLRILAIDNGDQFDAPFVETLSRMLLLPNNKVMEFKHWASIGRYVIKSIQDEAFLQWAISKSFFSDEPKIKDRTKERIDAERQEIIRILSRFHEDMSLFATIAIRNTVFLTSEGSLLLDPYETFDNSVSTLLGIRNYVHNTTIAEQQVSQEEFSYWLKITNLLLQPVSQSFKDDFQQLIEYEVPFGLSPEIETKSIKSLLSDPSKIALVPLAYGAYTAGSAIASHDWGVALMASGISSISSLFLMGPSSFQDIIFPWIKSKLHRGKEGKD